MSAWIAVLLLGIGAVVLLNDTPFMIWGLDSEHFGTLAVGVGLLMLLFALLGRAYQGRVGEAVRIVTTWLLIGLAGFAGYSYRYEIGQLGYRIAGEFGGPHASQSVELASTGENSVRIRRRGDGHFIASVTVNGASVPMLVDTGASTVVLKHADARKLGLDVARLKYTVPVQTANGIAYAAHVRLRSASIGPITVGEIDALVTQQGALRESLLGMTFLSRLRSYEFAGNFLTFRN